jgi:hypothetical protein
MTGVKYLYARYETPQNRATLEFMSYKVRLLEYHREKSTLSELKLTSAEYELAAREIAEKYGV